MANTRAHPRRPRTPNLTTERHRIKTCPFSSNIYIFPARGHGTCSPLVSSCHGADSNRTECHGGPSDHGGPRAAEAGPAAPATRPPPSGGWGDVSSPQAGPRSHTSAGAPGAHEPPALELLTAAGACQRVPAAAPAPAPGQSQPEKARPAPSGGKAAHTVRGGGALSVAPVFPL